MSDHTVYEGPTFGMEVEHNEWWDPDTDETRKGWLVNLPHRCDSWDIAGDGYRGVSKVEALERLLVFIGEARDALHALKEADDE